MKVYIDKGHDEFGGDPGAVSGSLREGTMNVITANALSEQLKQRGAEVKLEPGDLSINASARAANDWGADLLISVHYNAGGGDRGEVITKWTDESLTLATAIAAGLKKAGQSEVRVYKSKPNSTGTSEYFGILRIAKMAAVIVEPAFIDNINDRQLIDTPEKQKRIGVAIANAIADAYGLKGGDKMIYKTINDIPDWGKPVIQKLMNRKSINGDGKGNINISEDMLRILVILNNEGVLK